jgi:hypothetical protein
MRPSIGEKNKKPTQNRVGGVAYVVKALASLRL